MRPAPGSSTEQRLTPSTRRWLALALGLLWLVLTVALLACMTRGPGERIGVSPPRPGYQVGSGVYANPPFLGFEHWPLVAEIAVLAQALAMYGWYGWRSWRQRRVQPVLVMLIVGTLISPLWDPLISWAAFTAYDPRLLHVPETWPLYDIVPTVQPLATLPGYAMFFVSAVVPGLLLHRLLTRRARPGALIERRPLLTLFLVVGVWAAIFDAIQAYIATRFEIITYSQIAVAAFRPGTTWQSNIFWEPFLCFVMFGIAALTVYEDDAGHTIAHRWRRLPHRPLLREFILSFVVITLATALYTGAFALVRLSGTPTSVACPWPYQDTVVYDPDGLYAKNCPADAVATPSAIK
ncbi:MULTISPECIES: spirocyclase AveC family protein [unclassified Mycobacterium]|uniref:spirocyclase AveC family protein n=1 Tax=unclassified Mycobacterium TaxID=2642494 RepID=UPI0029C8DA62|nr:MULTISPECIES: spirocyclase AveC family protein [unclassified Mycobacterium]